MKSATIVLAAVTVFTTLVPESTTTPVALSLGWQPLDNIAGKVVDGVGTAVGKVGDIVKGALGNLSLEQAIDKVAEAINQTVSSDVDEALRDIVYYRLNRAEIILANLIASIEEAVAKTFGVENVVMTKTLVQLRSLQGVAAVLYPSVRLAVRSGNNLAMKISADISMVVIGVGEVLYSEIVTSLELTPGEVAAAAAARVQRDAPKIFALGKANVEDINKMLADRGYPQA